MKKLTKTLLTATLILSLPLGAYAASEGLSTTQPTQATATGCPMDGTGMMGGKASWRPPRQDGPHEEHDPGTDPGPSATALRQD